MVYFCVCEDDGSELVPVSPYYATYQEAYDDYVKMGGLEDSKLTIEEYKEPSLEEEMNC